MPSVKPSAKALVKAADKPLENSTPVMKSTPKTGGLFGASNEGDRRSIHEAAQAYKSGAFLFGNTQTSAAKQSEGLLGTSPISNTTTGQESPRRFKANTLFGNARTTSASGSGSQRSETIGTGNPFERPPKDGGKPSHESTQQSKPSNLFGGQNNPSSLLSAIQASKTPSTGSQFNTPSTNTSESDQAASQPSKAGGSLVNQKPLPSASSPKAVGSRPFRRSNQGPSDILK